MQADDSVLLHVDVADGKRRLGGTALAQCYKQLGDTPPDVEAPELLAAAFATTQTLLRQKKLRAGHDVSDGGIIVAALEMAFGGDRSLALDVPKPALGGALEALFAEEVGLLFEVAPADEAAVLLAFREARVPCSRIGVCGPRSTKATVAVGGEILLEADIGALRDTWEASSFALEKLQAAPLCVAQEQAGLASRHAPAWRLTFTPALSAPLADPSARARVAVLRQEGESVEGRTPLPRSRPSGDASRRWLARGLEWRSHRVGVHRSDGGATPLGRSARIAPAALGGGSRRWKLPAPLPTQEGSNGDREMAAALHAAGLAPWDVTMADLAAGALSLDGAAPDTRHAAARARTRSPPRSPQIATPPTHHTTRPRRTPLGPRPPALAQASAASSSLEDSPTQTSLTRPRAGPR